MGKAKAPSAKKAAKEGLVKKNGDLEDTFKAVLGEIFRRFDKDGDGALCEADEQRMSGVHICVYIERFKQAYDTLLCVDARTPPHTSPRPPRSVAL